MLNVNRLYCPSWCSFCDTLVLGLLGRMDLENRLFQVIHSPGRRSPPCRETCAPRIRNWPPDAHTDLSRRLDEKAQDDRYPCLGHRASWQDGDSAGARVIKVDLSSKWGASFASYLASDSWRHCHTSSGRLLHILHGKASAHPSSGTSHRSVFLRKL